MPGGHGGGGRHGRGIGSVAALIRWLRPDHVVGVGFAVAAAGFVALTRVDPVSGLPVLVAAGAVMAAGLGMVAALATDMVVATAPPERAGAASALSETGSEFGGALGIALPVWCQEVLSLIDLGSRGEFAGADEVQAPGDRNDLVAEAFVEAGQQGDLNRR